MPLIKEIREGVFRPDESRAGRLDNTKRQRVDEVLDETTDFSFPPAMPRVEVRTTPNCQEPAGKNLILQRKGPMMKGMVDM